MKFTLIKQADLSGRQTGIYSIKVDEDNETLLERFARENQALSSNEVTELLVALSTIGHHTGARENFFEPKEGKPGDGIEALCDSNKKLRLYCIRNGRVAVIVGGGGPKAKFTPEGKPLRAWQDDPKLSSENLLLQLVSKTLRKALLAHDLSWSNNGTELLGNLTIDTEDY